jgi:molybdate transport system ATP-binding protein
MLEVTLQHRFAGMTLDVAFSAPAGVTALFGRSGAGKTTVVNAIAGLLRPDGGRIALNGEVLSDTATGLHLPPHRRRIGTVFQDARLFPHLSVRQNLLYGRWFAGTGTTAPDLHRVAGMLDIEGLLDRGPHDLSGGEKQRVALGRALLSSPRMLLLDEPLAALDAARKAEILPYLERLRDDAGLPILYVSHALEEVARLATTLVVIEYGRVLRVAPASVALSEPDMAPILGLRQAGAVIPARLVAQHADGLSELATSGGTLWLPQITAPIGTMLRLRLPAQDVILSRELPKGLSALNILPATITQVRRGDGPGALIQLRSGSDLILARITQRSADALGLTEGTACYAILKSVAVAQSDVGLVA